MTDTTFERVRRLVEDCYPPGYEQQCLDADLRVMTRLAKLQDAGALAETSRELDRMLAQCPDEDSARRLLQPMLGASPPRAESYRSMIEDMQALAAAGRKDPGTLVRLTDDDDRPRTARASRFFDLETANVAARDVLRHHQAAVREWNERPAGIWRTHYYADLARPVGIVKDRLRDVSVEVTGAVVILLRDEDTRQVGLYQAYPELALDEAVRGRFADLPHLFGAYFGDVPDRPWLAQEYFHLNSHTGIHERMKEQMRELVTLDDAELRLAVEAFGSHVLPSNMRAWVDMIHWRMENYVYADVDGVPVDWGSMAAFQ